MRIFERLRARSPVSDRSGRNEDGVRAREASPATVPVVPLAGDASLSGLVLRADLCATLANVVPGG